MDSQFVGLCTVAAESYLQYLSEKNLGQSRIDVREIKLVSLENSLWQFQLSGKIFNVDSIQIEHLPTGTKIGPDAFTVRSYDADNKILLVKVLKIPEFLQGNCQPNTIRILSDMRFLVANVRDWYMKYGLSLSLSGVLSGMDFLPKFPLLDTPSQEQEIAIDTALTSPLSYVWGPPGTGKTRLVLTHCVLALEAKNMRVGVFAPTNIALEQAMDAVLEAATMLGIDKDRFLRLGNPSKDFADRHPEVCEVYGIEKRIEYSMMQVRVLDNAIAHRQKDHSCQTGQRMLDLIRQLNSTSDSIQETSRQHDELAFRKVKTESRLTAISTRILTAFTDRRRLTHNEIEQVSAQLHDLDQQITASRAHFASLLSDLGQMEIALPELEQIRLRFDPMRPLTYEPQLTSLVNTLRENLSDPELLAAVVPYRLYNFNELISRRNEYQAEIEKLRKWTTTERLNQSRVVGMTLDRYIRGFQDTPPRFDHLFLDEAGYTSLIKVLPLFLHGSPVTMLGDHEQLPPVVEGDDDSRPNKCFALWRTSAIYCETAFSENSTPDDWLKSLGNKPMWAACKCTQLKTSRRFGPNISDVLDKMIYKFGFQSANDHDLKVTLIDAPLDLNQAAKLRRQAPEEVDAISLFLKTRSIDLNKVAILTPYKNQAHLLGEHFRKLDHDERILSIHRSQGREWDTVILSVVDNNRVKNQPYFTDTTKSRGRKVLNTAVSRAKKELILVCDVSYWKRRKDAANQLVSRLIELSGQ